MGDAKIYPIATIRALWIALQKVDEQTLVTVQSVFSAH